MIENFWLRVGAIFGTLAVIAGTFGAHGLRVPDEQLVRLSLPVRQATLHRMENYETANRYHMYHALAIVAVGLVATRTGSPSRRRLIGAAGWLFSLGIVFFSGSLYALGIGGPRWLGAVAPVGGLGLIAGWISLALAGRGERSIEIS